MIRWDVSGWVGSGEHGIDEGKAGEITDLCKCYHSWWSEFGV